MKIINIKSREILDSRGFPTIETEVVLKGNFKGIASIPSGASTGTYEALELRDNDERYMGKGVQKAVNNVLSIIRPAIINKKINSQQELDQILINLDGTENKTVLGANAILSVSLAFLKACAQKNKKELYQYVGKDYSIPKCMMNILNGGMHADNNLEFQEFMIVPKRETIKGQLQVASEIFHNLKKILKENGYITSVGDEGGFAPNLKNNEEALEIIIYAIKKAGYKPYDDVNIALDIAASSFYNEETKTYKIDNKNITRDQLIEKYIEIIQLFLLKMLLKKMILKDLEY